MTLWCRASSGGTWSPLDHNLFDFQVPPGPMATYWVAILPSIPVIEIVFHKFQSCICQSVIIVLHNLSSQYPPPHPRSLQVESSRTSTPQSGWLYQGGTHPCIGAPLLSDSLRWQHWTVHFSGWRSSRWSRSRLPDHQLVIDCLYVKHHSWLTLPLFLIFLRISSAGTSR